MHTDIMLNHFRMPCQQTDKWSHLTSLLTSCALLQPGLVGALISHLFQSTARLLIRTPSFKRPSHHPPGTRSSANLASPLFYIMPRITRAKAAQSTEGMHIKGDAALDVSESENGCVNSKDTTPTRNLPARKPLGEITPNSSGTKSEEEQSMAQQPQQQQQQQTTTIKAGKGARKGAKGKTTEEAESQPDDRMGDMKLTMSECRAHHPEGHMTLMQGSQMPSLKARRLL